MSDDKWLPSSATDESSPELMRLRDSLAPKRTGVHVRRGPQLATRPPRLYVQQPRELTGQDSSALCWGGAAVPLNRSNLHFLVAGVPGTGKTLTFRMLMQSVFQRTLPGTDRALVYDPKLEFYPILRDFGLSESEVVIANPFDHRCHAWDLAKDFDSPAASLQLARTIIPCPDSHAQPFFPKAAASVLAAVIETLIQTKHDDWDLADVLLSCLSIDAIEKCFSNANESATVAMARGVFGSSDTRSNVFAEIASRLHAFLPIAALWRNARHIGRTFSLKPFVESSRRVLLLGANETNKEALMPVYRLLVKRMGEITLDHVADGQWQAMNRTWLFLDELRELGNLRGLSDLISKGRSRGICAVLGFQDYKGIVDSFGENAAHELVSCCHHKLFLRLSGESAEWASKIIGRAEVAETQFAINTTKTESLGTSVTDQTGSSEVVSRGGGSSQTHGGGNSSSYGPQGTTTTSSSTWSVTNSDNWGAQHGTNESMAKSLSAGINASTSVNVSVTVRETDVVLASEISHLPDFKDGKGLHGFFCESLAGGQAVVHRLTLHENLFDGLDKKLPLRGFIPANPDNQRLRF